MYFPYLYGRRFELLALRDLVGELPLAGTAAPILEPVKNNPNELKRCLQVLGAQQVQTVVIMNPRHGDFRDGDSAQIRAALVEDFAQHPSLLPGFICDQRSGMREITNFLARYPNRDVAVLYWGPHLTIDELRRVVTERRIRFHISLHGQLAADLRTILPAGKAVEVRDRFNSLPRNADYNGSEYFTDGHLTFRQGAVGYGDFSVIGSTYRESGGPAHAVAIHAIFRQNQTGQLWVEHFVSDDVDREVGSVESKYHQAAAKLVRAAARRRTEFGQNGGLAAYAADVQANYFPGLGENKRRQIRHHIAVNHHILRGDL
jgi:hypothetical protein